MSGSSGFSIVETTIAMALTLVVTAAVFSMLRPAGGTLVVSEVADLQQRLRVAQETLARDLGMAGAGPSSGINAGTLIRSFAPLLPFRQGAARADVAGTFATDRVTALYVETTSASTVLGEDLSPGDTTIHLRTDAGCPLDVSGLPRRACGFTTGSTALVYDDGGRYDTFSVTRVGDREIGVDINRSTGSMTATYHAGKAVVVEAQSHTYYVKIDDPSSTYQLMHYDGSGSADTPVVDHVVALTFEYFGDPLPPAMVRPAADADGPWTTYGPKPDEGVENCVFTGELPPRPKLATMGGRGALVRLGRAELTDGPWCPDEANPNRWDADLLRIRKVAITLRLQSAVAALRGPAGVLFAHGGTSVDANRWVPDQTVRFDVSPRNLNFDR